MGTITLCKTGDYRLLETSRGLKILYLDERAFTWKRQLGGYDMEEADFAPAASDRVLSLGEYRLFIPASHDRNPLQRQLELEVGAGIWQGYVLLDGLPIRSHSRVRSVPTHLAIDNNPLPSGLRYSLKLDMPLLG